MIPEMTDAPLLNKARLAILPAGVRVEIQAGTWLLEAVEQAGVQLGFGCLNGACGTCAVEVVKGASGLDSPSDAELATLERRSFPAGRHRLVCCARILYGEVTIRLAPFASPQ
jgi:ferredoxin